MLLVRIISSLFKCSKKGLNKADCESTNNTCEEHSESTNFNPLELLNKGYEEVCRDIQEGVQSEKVQAIMELRSHAFCYNYTFMGVVESTKFKRLNLEDYDGTDELPSSFLIQKVDFGYNINKSLSTLFGLKLRRRMGMCKTILVLEDGIVYNIEEKLSKLLMHEVKIKFIENDNLTNLEK